MELSDSGVHQGGVVVKLEGVTRQRPSLVLHAASSRHLPELRPATPSARLAALAARTLLRWLNLRMSALAATLRSAPRPPGLSESRLRNWLDLAGETGSGIASYESAPFVVGQTAPDSGVLALVDGPFQAGFTDLAATAYRLGLLDLEQGGAGAPDREEELGVLFQT
jgi:hypothetical protein